MAKYVYILAAFSSIGIHMLHGTLESNLVSHSPPLCRHCCCNDKLCCNSTLTLLSLQQSLCCAFIVGADSTAASASATAVVPKILAKFIFLPSFKLQCAAMPFPFVLLLILHHPHSAVERRDSIGELTVVSLMDTVNALLTRFVTPFPLSKWSFCPELLHPIAF